MSYQSFSLMSALYSCHVIPFTHVPRVSYLLTMWIKHYSSIFIIQQVSNEFRITRYLCECLFYTSTKFKYKYVSRGESRGEGCESINRLKSTTFVWISQNRILNVIFRGLCVCVLVRIDCSFCWYYCTCLSFFFITVCSVFSRFMWHFLDIVLGTPIW